MAHHHGGKLLRASHITSSSEISDARIEGEGMRHVHKEQRNMQRKERPEENSEVHLLPAFALPPRGVDDGKRQRRKRKKLMPITTNTGKK